MGGHLEGAAGPGRGLLEDQGDVLSPEPGLLGPVVFGLFQVRREVQQETDLLRSEIQELEKVSVAKGEGHRSSCSFLCLFGTGLSAEERSQSMLEFFSRFVNRTHARPAMSLGPASPKTNIYMVYIMEPEAALS